MYTEETSQSWGSRLGNAVAGVLVGIALIGCAFYGIFWNESHGMHMQQSLQQTEQSLVSIPTEPINPQNNLKPVYLTGLATTNDKLVDQLFDIADVAIKLERKVLMYQWQEREHTETQSQVGGSEKEIKTYDYKPIWAEKLIDSSKFKQINGHENPDVKPIESLYQTSAKVTVGDFILSADLVSDIQGETVVNLPTFNPSQLQARLNTTVTHVNDYFYIGKSAQAPQIGDLKVYINEVKPQTVSIIAAQSGTELQPYLAPAGQQISLLAMGQVPAALMIHNAEEENKLLTWAYRLLALLAMVIGLSLIMRPIVVLADFIPFFGSIVGFGTGLLALIGGLILWGCGTAIAWFAIRPVWAIGLLIIVILLSYLLFINKKAA